MQLAPVYHGSHVHPMIRAYGTERPGRNVRQCTLCRGSIDTNQDQQARRCTQCPEFMLCFKCFEVEEFPLPSPQVVVRNPTLLRGDDTICVRTRPRSNAYVLCPIPAGELIEVVAYTISKDGDEEMYFRQQTGGWIRTAHVVCVLPSERSIAQLAKVHYDHHYDGHAEPLSMAACFQLMEETNDLLHDSPDFGGVMGFLTLLPLHITLFGNPLAGTTSATQQCTHLAPPQQAHVAGYLLQLLSTAHGLIEEHLTMPPRARSLDAALSFHVKMCARVLAMLLRIPAEHIAAASAADFNSRAHGAHLVSLAARALQRVLATTAEAASAVEPMPLGDERDVPKNPNVQKKDLCGASSTSRHDTWSTWHGDNACNVGSGSAVALRGVAWYGIELAAQLVMCHCRGACHEGSATIAPEITEMSTILLSAITCAEQLPESLAFHVCSALHQSLLEGGHHVADLQWEIYNMDVVEVAMKMLKDAKDERRVLSALNLIRCIVEKNPRMIQLLATVVIGPLLQFIRSAARAAELSAAFDVCSAFAFNAPEGRSCSSDRAHQSLQHGVTGSSLLPVCTSKLHPNATPFQPMHFFEHNTTGNVIAFCAHCAVHHAPQGFTRSVPLTTRGEGSEEATSHAVSSGLRAATEDDAPAPYRYFSCQCHTCLVSQEQAPVLAVPPVPMTLAQKLLGAGRILSVMAQRLRTHGASVVNAVGRLSMLLCCNEEVAVAMFCSLITESLVPHPDGVLAVAACTQFGQMRYLMTLYQQSSISCYLDNPMAYIHSIEGQSPAIEAECTTPQQHSRKDVHQNTADHSDVGLTPSPGTLSTTRGPALADPSDAQATIELPVRLFSTIHA